MANSCFTLYAFDGKKEELVEFYDKLKTLKNTTNPDAKDECGHLYLGYIVESFGGSTQEIECNGTIETFCLFQRDSETPRIKMCTVTDSIERCEIWDIVLKNYPSIKYYYIASEIGNEYFATNDIEGKYFPERYAMNETEQDIVYCETKDELFDALSKRLGVKITSQDEIADALIKFGEANKGKGVDGDDLEMAVEIYKMVTPMPTWCKTDYVIEGDAAKIAELHSKFQELKGNELSIDNDFSRLWLGSIFIVAGKNCRGKIEGLELVNATTIKLSTQTSWEHPSKVNVVDVCNVMQQSHPDLKCYFRSEQYEDSHYSTNDTERKHFTERYVVEESCEELKYHNTIEEVISDISKRVKVPISSIKQLDDVLQEWNCTDEDVEIAYYEVKDTTILMTPNGFKFRTTKEIDPNWNGFDKSTAECHMSNYGVIFLDFYSNGAPIDNEYDLESAYDLIQKNSTKTKT